MPGADQAQSDSTRRNQKTNSSRRPQNTTHRYVEANLEMKEKALARLEAPDIKLQRLKADDDLLKFLRSL